MAKPPTPVFIGTDHYYAGGNKPIRWIVVHATVSPCEPGGARSIARYFQGPGLSAHYVVDPGEVVQCVHDWDRAWHCGSPGNNRSIGIELCSYVPPHGSWSDRDHEAMLQRAAGLVAQLCAAYGVPKRKLSPHDVGQHKHGVCGHWDITRGVGGTTHHDPGEAFPWQHFMKFVHQGGDDMPSEKEIWHWDGIESGHKDNPKWTPATFLKNIEADGDKANHRLNLLLKAVADLAKHQGAPVDVDEQEVAAQVIAALDPAAIADAVVDRLGVDQARVVVDELGRRLAP